jgi:hypothetical protein
MIIYHKHHIIPRHMGGTDDPSNLVDLTIEEHAEAHRILWEQHGKSEDLLAWQGLSNLISKKEILRNLGKEKRGKIWVTDDTIHKLISPDMLEEYERNGFRRGRLPMSEQGKANVKAASPKKRKPLTEEHKKNIRKALEGNNNSGTGPRKKEYKTSWYSYEKYLQKRG